MGTKGESNRTRIVNAADDLFYRRGYNRTSFQDISDATGIPRGNFYYYFKTKDEILNAVVDSRVAELKNMLMQCENETEDRLQRILMLTDILELKRDDVLQSGCPMGTLSSELAKGDPVLHEKARQGFSLLRDWLYHQFSALGLPDADELAMDLLAKIQGVTVLACAFEDSGYIKRGHKEIRDWVHNKTAGTVAGDAA